MRDSHRLRAESHAKTPRAAQVLEGRRLPDLLVHLYDGRGQHLLVHALEKPRPRGDLIAACEQALKVVGDIGIIGELSGQVLAERLGQRFGRIRSIGVCREHRQQTGDRRRDGRPRRALVEGRRAAIGVLRDNNHPADEPWQILPNR